MERIDGHLIDNSKLSDGGWILDAGCRHFKLPIQLGSQFKYLCLDPDPTIKPPDTLSNHIILHKKIALVKEDGEVKYCGWSTGEGNYCYKDEAPHYATMNIKVKAKSLNTLMKEHKIKQFELIKLDVEGSEYDILLGIETKVAKQIAVEFHQALGYNPYGTHKEYIMKLMSSPFGKNYIIHDYYEYKELKGIYEYNFQAL